MVSDYATQPRIAVIGAGGKKGLECLRVLRARPDVQVVSCVVNQSVPEELAASGVKIIRDGEIEQLVDCGCQIVVVSLPHQHHQAVACRLLEAGIYVIKEKPLALRTEDVAELAALASQNGLPPVFTTVQRSRDPLFLKARSELSSIGPIRSFSYSYAFALPSMTTGWRAERAKSGGGVLIDMGYHIVDIVQQFFGRPIESQGTFGFAYPEMRSEGLDDSANISLVYEGFSGEIRHDRHAAAKAEEFFIEGERGQLRISPDQAMISKTGLIDRVFDYCLDVERNRSSLEPRLPPHLSAMPRRSGAGFVRFSSRIVHRLFASSQRPNHHPLPRSLPEQIR